MAQKIIKINGIDFTSYVPRAGYSVSYKKVHGGAGGVTLAGSTTEDILAIKAIVTVPIIPVLGDAKIAALIDALYEFNYPELYYFDPRRKLYREVETLFDGAEALHAGTNIMYDEVWKSPSLVFTER